MSEALVNDALVHPRERLRRLLFLVPFVSRRPGLTVDEVAQALGVSKPQLLADLEWLPLVGRPPFRPDDFVDIYVENERVYVELDQRLSAPPRFTVEEGVALAAAAELMRPLASAALQAAKEKLEQTLPLSGRERFEALILRLDVSAPRQAPLRLLREAIEARREVELDYFTFSRAQSERRRLQPRALRFQQGQWYLSAFCLSRQDERLFRVDRIAHLSLTSTTFEAPEPSPEAPTPSSSPAAMATVRFSAAAAAYAREQFQGEVRAGPSGSTEVEVSAENPRWLVSWVVSFGGEATLLSPPELRERVAQWVTDVAK